MCNKQYLSLLVVFLLVANSALSKEWVSINSNSSKQADLKLVGSSEFETVVELNLDGYYQSLVNTGLEQAYIISLLDASPIIKKGTPDLCKISQSIIIADDNATQISILESSFVDFENIAVNSLASLK